MLRSSRPRAAEGTRFSKSTRSRGWLIALTAGVFGLAGCQDAPPPPKVDPTPSKGVAATDKNSPGPATPAAAGSPSPTACARWVAQKNLGVGQLENMKFEDADRTFAELTSQLPEEILPHRNLAITRILALAAGDSQKESQADPKKNASGVTRESLVRGGEDAVKKLLEVDPKSPISHLLAARIARVANRQADAANEFKQAAELAPDDPAIQYQVFEFGREWQDDPDASEALRRQTLARLRKLRPDNIAVMLALLEEQRQNPGPELGETFQQMKPIVLWLGPSVKAQAQTDLKKIFAQADAAIEKKQWPQLFRPALSLNNVLRPQPATANDLARLNPNLPPPRVNLMEYVLHDFSEKFLLGCPSSAIESPAIAVKFVEFPGNRQPHLRTLASVTDTHSPAYFDLAVADFDLDGLLDLWVLRSEYLMVVTQPGGLMRWKRAALYPVRENYTRVLVADLDNDYPQDGKNPQADQKARQSNPPAGRLCHDVDLDAVIYGPAGVKVLRNDWNSETDERKFRTVEQSTEFEAIRDVLTVAIVDLDHDGDLDLAISAKSGLSLWSNRGDMTFADISGQCRLPARETQPKSLLPLDWNRNLNINLVLGGTEKQPVGLLENVVHGRFRWVPFEEEFAALAAAGSLRSLGGDASGSWNIVAGGAAGGTVVKTISPQPGRVRVEQAKSFTKTPLQGLSVLDYDNDGEADVVTWSKAGLGLFRDQAGELRDVSTLLPKIPPLETDLENWPVLACIPGDVDRDGDLDLAILTGVHFTWLMNDGGNKNHWLTVKLRAEQRQGSVVSASGRANQYAVGSIVEVRAANRYQAQVVSGSETHFGLGSAKKADIVRAIWTNGIPQNVLAPDADQEICEHQSLGGSCPYLYTWNGKQFEFVTDLLWNGPIGMRFDEQTFAPYRPWEYLKVSGDKLAPRNGKYVLQFTEELWEATYVDQVKLLAIDHPAEIDIYSNEKVGSAELAKFQVHTVRKPRLPTAARDKHGRDVLPVISKTDGQFLRGYDVKYRQGVTDEHFLELDLGKLDQPKKITLFLTGWIYPPTPSINLALAQNPNRITWRPPFIQVPDAQGNWKEVVPFMGFPGGKTKTIAVDLSSIFLTKDYRLRIITSQEIYWDSAFFTVDEEAAPFTQTELPLLTADIHFRGCSRSYHNSLFGPELYHYDQLDSPREWLAMGGAFTRYGDVRELLTATDDRFVIIGAGDEITLEFAVPKKPLPAGWKRDFLMYNVGYDKDCDRNTLYGHEVEPLPFAAMTRYPYGSEESYPDTPLHRETLRKYHTRHQNPQQFWRMLLPQ